MNVLLDQSNVPTPQPPNTIEIAPGVFMPFANMGGSDGHYSNYSLWMELGGRGFDSALSYTKGDVQQKLGEAIRSSGIPRSELFITTKIPCCSGSTSAFGGYYCSGHPHAHPQPDEDIDSTLSQIGLEYADLIILHWGCLTLEETVATYKGLERAFAAGKARAIGISNFNASAIEALLPEVSIKPAYNMCGRSIGKHKQEEKKNGNDDVTRATCDKHGITYGAYSPLSKGNALKHQEVVDIANTHNVSTATVALRWLVQDGIPFTTASEKESYDRSDLQALDIELADDEMTRLNGVGSVVV